MPLLFFLLKALFAFLKLNYQKEASIVSESDCHRVFQDLRAAEVLSFLHLILLIDSKACFSTSQILVSWL